MIAIGQLQRKTLWLMGVFIAIGAWIQPASANDEVFVVPRVFVSAQADSATAAKQNAVIQGRREAMDVLLRRLTPESDWNYLPRLKNGQLAPLGTPAEQAIINEALDQRQFNGFGGKQVISLNDQMLQELEQGFEVFEEKSSPTTYRAYITYRFKPAETRNLLITAQIPYSEAQTRMALVLPVLETARGLYLWEQNNPWLKAWQARPLGHELTPMAAPLGDLEDSATVSARDAMRLDQEKLGILAQRYGVPQVIIAHGRLSQENGEDTLQVQLINAYRESGALTPDSQAYSESEALDGLADGTSRQLGQDSFSSPTVNNVGIGADGTIAGEPGDVLAESWLKEASGNFPGLSDRAILASVTKYASGWKGQTLIDHSVSSVISASAFFRSLSEWKKIRAALVSTPLVGSVQVRNLSREGAELSIRAFGDPGKLVVAMESQGLSLWTYDQGPVENAVWNIATPATASTVPARIQRAPAQDFGRRRRGIFGENDSSGLQDNNPDLPFLPDSERAQPASTPVIEETPYD